MSPIRLGFKRPYALFIIILMLLGVIAGVYYFYNLSTSGNPCGAPTTATFSQVYETTIQDTTYTAINATFTGTQQNINFAHVQFVTESFSDPSIPHLVENVCGIDNSTPASIQVRVTFDDGRTEFPTLPSFKGTTYYQTSSLTTDHTPSAGLFWFPGDSYVVLVVSI